MARINTFEQRDEVGFNGFLESTDGRRLESEVGLEVLRNFPDETLEREFTDQKLSRLLVTTDFTKSNGTWAVTMGLLDTSGSVYIRDVQRGNIRRCRFSCCLGGELFARGFATSGLASSLLSTSHL
jgi:hypothetical protein